MGDSDGNGAMLWQMLCGVKVMCGNHSKCNSDGKCNWMGDYGSYQEHIRCCTNTPLIQHESKTSHDSPGAAPDMTTTSDDVKTEGHESEIETTASELSEVLDSEGVCGFE